MASASTYRSQYSYALPLVDRLIASVAYVGGAALLFGSALASIFRKPAVNTVKFYPAFCVQLDWLLSFGLPLVGLAHVGMGSFLAMQAYFGATFVEATGPVVGVGLIRNMAPLLTGLVLAALQATRTIPELRRRGSGRLDCDPSAVQDRGSSTPLGTRDPGRLTLTRLAAAVAAGPIFALWGSAVGTLVGFSSANSMLGVSHSTFFVRLAEMLWVRDVVGLVLKGAGFAAIGALLACYEGVRKPEDAESSHDCVASSALRAVVLTAVIVLLFNALWFILAYVAGPPFGPTVLKPPTRS